MEKFYRYSAKVIKIVDGDTVDAMIDLGFDIWIKRRIRFYGIDTPETRTTNLEEKEKGLLSKARVTQLIEEHDNNISIESHGVGKYGRCLATVYVDGINVNKLLIEEGLATHFMDDDS